MNLLEETCAHLARLIAFPTVSSDSNLEMIAHLAGVLELCGARVEVQHDESGTKANLLATIGPEGDGGIMLSGHSDVVPVDEQTWQSDPFEMVEHDGKLFGRGTCDMKGFIAACLAIAPRFAEVKPTRPIHFAFTHDEEVGCIGAGHLVQMLQDKGLRPAMAIIGEPTEMRIIEGHKGCNEYTTHFHGLAGHGSAPEMGVSAVEYAVRYVGRILELKDQLRARAPEGSRFEPPWTTINVGGLHGGVAHNVIAENAWVEWDMRPVQRGDAEFVKADLRAYCDEVLLPAMQKVHPDARIETEVIGEVEGLTPMEENEARRVVAELTGANTAGLVPFGTEAGIFQTFGMDVVVCGPGSIEQAHKPDEFIAIEQLGACLEMLEKLVARVAA
ncbi:acetylornithine deacetylase [Rhodobacteraceae bacterium D3-12]|nr:acetylornithine deacetylase [Rhodobacteraceae bacterium D3-12]